MARRACGRIGALAGHRLRPGRRCPLVAWTPGTGIGGQPDLAHADARHAMITDPRRSADHAKLGASLGCRRWPQAGSAQCPLTTAFSSRWPPAVRGALGSRAFPLIVANRLHVDAGLRTHRSDGQFSRGLATIEKRPAARGDGSGLREVITGRRATRSSSAHRGRPGPVRPASEARSGKEAAVVVSPRSDCVGRGPPAAPTGLDPCRRLLRGACMCGWGCELQYRR
jgi:hypothetical protein